MKNNFESTFVHLLWLSVSKFVPMIIQKVWIDRPGQMVLTKFRGPVRSRLICLCSFCHELYLMNGQVNNNVGIYYALASNIPNFNTPLFEKMWRRNIVVLLSVNLSISVSFMGKACWDVLQWSMLVSLCANWGPWHLSWHDSQDLI